MLNIHNMMGKLIAPPPCINRDINTEEDANYKHLPSSKEGV